METVIKESSGTVLKEMVVCSKHTKKDYKFSFLQIPADQLRVMSLSELYYAYDAFNEVRQALGDDEANFGRYIFQEPELGLVMVRVKGYSDDTYHAEVTLITAYEDIEDEKDLKNCIYII